MVLQRAYIVEVDEPGEAPEHVATEERIAWIDEEMQQIKVAVRAGIEGLRGFDPDLEVIDSAPLFPTLVVFAHNDVIERLETVRGVKRVYPSYEVKLEAG